MLNLIFWQIVNIRIYLMIYLNFLNNFNWFSYKIWDIFNGFFFKKKMKKTFINFFWKIHSNIKNNIKLILLFEIFFFIKI